MLNTDVEARRLLVREHQEALRRDALRASVTDTAPAESTRRHLRFRLPRLRIRIYIARGVR